jgi:hypothetical protein
MAAGKGIKRPKGNETTAIDPPPYDSEWARQLRRRLVRQGIAGMVNFRNYLDVLRNAIRDGATSDVVQLINLGVDVNSTSEYDDARLLEVAATVGNLEAAELLVAAGAVTSHVNKVGATALDLAETLLVPSLPIAILIA